MTVQHHELCFGCGRSNLLGLHMEADRPQEDALHARFVVRDDHVGNAGSLHTGVLTAALHEAMALALHAGGLHATARHVEVEFPGSAAAGTLIELTAAIQRRDKSHLRLEATADGPDGTIAHATGDFVFSATR